MHGDLTRIGSVYGDLYVGGAAPARSHYLKQVERLAPPELVGRAAEIAQLTDFCRSGGGYLWLRAPAWSGKSALLSSFVLEPPDGVVVVSFFITANLARQADRRAFVDSVLEQLCALLGRPFPHHSPETNREAHLLGLLAEAARLVRDRGEHFALVVDGLDEDLGVDGGHDAHSIAALLPVDPPAGMRVIVAGRPAPPLPVDLPEHHPLRGDSVVFPLTPSEKGKAVRASMERDLKRLLTGTAVERDLLGLVTAAGGGLGTADLAALTDCSVWEVEDRLETVAGRSFTRLPGVGGDSPDVLVLAHERLLVTARRMLHGKLAPYHERLHTWADDHAARGWPSDTPEFLFRGYFALLTAIGDHARMVRLATDPARHRWLLRTTYTDSAALAEIAATQAVLRGVPDLANLARLAVHRAALLRPNNRFPTNLAAAWAMAGQTERAEEMAGLFVWPPEQIDSLLATQRAVRDLGETERADRLLAQAEAACARVHQFFGGRPIALVAAEYERLGECSAAERVSGLGANEFERIRALTVRAGATVATDRAWELIARAEAVTSVEQWPSRALADLATVVHGLGEPVRATDLLAAAESNHGWTGALKSPGHADLLTAAGFEVDGILAPIDADYIAECAAEVGDVQQAVRLAAQVDKSNREPLIDRLVERIARLDSGRAEELARPTADGARLGVRLAIVAASATGTRATDLIAEAETLAGETVDPVQRSTAFLAVATALAEKGDTGRAVEMARDYARPEAGNAVVRVAARLLRAGDVKGGTGLLELVEVLTRGRYSVEDERRAVKWVQAMVDFGDLDHAERAAAGFADATARSAAWAVIVEGAVRRGALDLAERALAAVEDEALRRCPRLDLIRGRLAEGDHARAADLAGAAPDPEHAADALAVVAADSRLPEHLALARRAVDAVPEPHVQRRILLDLLEAAASSGRRTAVEDLVGDLDRVTQEGLTRLETPSLRRGAARFLGLRRFSLRSLREIVETIDSHRRVSMSPTVSLNVSKRVVPVEPPARRTDTAGLPADQVLAVELVERDWHYVLDDLLDRHPEIYPVILAEVDKLSAGVV